MRLQIRSFGLQRIHEGVSFIDSRYFVWKVPHLVSVRREIRLLFLKSLLCLQVSTCILSHMTCLIQIFIIQALYVRMSWLLSCCDGCICFWILMHVTRGMAMVSIWGKAIPLHLLERRRIQTLWAIPTWAVIFVDFWQSRLAFAYCFKRLLLQNLHLITQWCWLPCLAYWLRR